MRQFLQKRWLRSAMVICGMITLYAVCPYLCLDGFTTVTKHACCPQSDQQNTDHDCEQHSQPFVANSSGLEAPVASKIIWVATLQVPDFHVLFANHSIDSMTTGPPLFHPKAPLYLADLHILN